MLTDAQVRNAKPAAKPYKLSDAAGLYLFVRPTGSKQWRFDYKFNARRKTLTIGTYPYTSLQEARQSLHEAKNALSKSIDPALKPASATFKDVAEEWLKKLENEGDAAPTMEKKRWLLSYAYPYIGNRNLTDITAPELLRVLRKLEGPGKYESAKRLRSVLSRVFRYGIATARAERDPAADLRGALTAPKIRHRAAFTEPDDIKTLLLAIDDYQGSQTIKFALQFLALTFVRPGELRHAEWTEIQGEEWRVPAHKMKMKLPHIVPLSRQALAIIEQSRAINGNATYVFPSLVSPERPMSENTLNVALRRLGFAQDEMCSHGFRTMASTRLNEMNWHPDAIERQLAHRPINQVRAAYNQAQYLPERQRMMQAWADYLDELRKSSATSQRTG
ncbi:MAG: tyrosine-type recombinase/integrase [Hyphomicrobium sp.]|uniref:tyrosine-type recombinase/integrase n=1 Tax=Hyphomicrobium sp. TaxID=82 RepID=UPI00132299DA|nr:integrase arm-type DNA-binding domain-containing protein [Hyphomicrobium sp.]KAB2939373.1 MAG: tyrosine-type recombinase/integrase [Hyphomicrobium sp.]MBZ0211194.1 tyrosine-type recombinase/integrase [Hyphomicrobium sp.]